MASIALLGARAIAPFAVRGLAVLGGSSLIGSILHGHSSPPSHPQYTHQVGQLMGSVYPQTGTPLPMHYQKSENVFEKIMDYLPLIALAGGGLFVYQRFIK